MKETLSKMWRILRNWRIFKVSLPVTDRLQLLPLRMADLFCRRLPAHGEWVGDHSEYRVYGKFLAVERDCDNDWQCISVAILGVTVLFVDDWNDEPLEAWIFPGIRTCGSQVKLEVKLSLRVAWWQLRDRFTDLPF